MSNFRKSKGLFQAAIIQSGPINFPGLKFDEFKSMIDIYKDFASNLGCTQNVVECLNRKSASELTKNFNQFDQCNGMKKKAQSSLKAQRPQKIGQINKYKSLPKCSILVIIKIILNYYFWYNIIIISDEFKSKLFFIFSIFQVPIVVKLPNKI